MLSYIDGTILDRLDTSQITATRRRMRTHFGLVNCLTTDASERKLYGDEIGNFERAVAGAGEFKVIWEQFCEVPEFSVETATIASDWLEKSFLKYSPRSRPPPSNEP